MNMIKISDRTVFAAIALAVLTFSALTGLDEVRATTAESHLLTDSQVAELREARANDVTRYVELMARHYGPSRN